MNKKYIKPILFLFNVFTLILIFENCEQNDVNTVEFDLTDTIDNYIKSFPEWDKFNGIILVADRDSVLFHKCYGMSSLEFGIPINKNTRFQIGSITKAFTAILTLKLVEDGLIDLNKSISEYLPYYPKNTGKKITVKHLLSNTSGIPHHYQIIPDYFKTHDHYFHTPKELISLFWSAPLKHNPGERFTYSSPGYYILGVILQQVTHKSYSELLKQYIFDPLGMQNTYVDNNKSTDQNLATGYKRGISGLVKTYSEDKSTALAAGDIISTAYDLYLWQKMLSKKGDDVLSEQSKNILFEPVVSSTTMTIIGPHFKIPYENGYKILEVNLMNGSSAGYVSYLARQINNDRCVIVLSNVNNTDVARIADDIGDIYNRRVLGISIGEEASLTRDLPKPAKISNKDIQNVIGFYKANKGNYLGIVQDNNQLFYLDFNRDYGIQMGMALTPFDANSFYMSHNTSFRCAFNDSKENEYQSLEALRKDRCFKRATRVNIFESKGSEYKGYFTSVELQKTIFFDEKNDRIVCENFIDNRQIILIELEEDLFGYVRGFIRFNRDSNNKIDGFDLFTINTDKVFGSKFVKIVY